MEYNSSRDKLIIAEYGRNVQKMVQYATTLENRDERTNLAKMIVNVMAQLNPQIKEYTDYKQNLWDQLHIISDFKLDVDSPYPAPTAASVHHKPKRIAYPTNKIKYKHYGKIVELMIKEASTLDEGIEKQVSTLAIANFMKQSFTVWNKDQINDELIIEHLKELSGGKLQVAENAKLNQNIDMNLRNDTTVRKKKKKKNGNHGSYRNRKNR